MKHGYIVIEGDTHAGHRHGLCPSVMTVKDKDDGEDVDIYPNLNAVQKRLLAIREANLSKLPELVKRKPWLYIHMGDQVNGEKYIDDAMEIGRYKQTMIAYHNMAPILDLNPKYVRIAAGTPSHDNDTDLILADYYQQHYPKLDIRTAWHGLTAFHGYRIDHKHHGPNGGYRNWTKGNAAWHYLRSEVMDECNAGREPPSLYLRGHIHVDLWVTFRHKWRGKWYTSDLVTVPSMCGVGCYARQAIRNLKSVTNGMTIIEIRDDRLYDVHWWADTQNLRYEEEIE